MERSSFLDELRRRRVLRVSGLYLALAWAITEFSSTVFPSLHMPQWTVTVVILLLIFGFPVCVLMAWIFNIGATGIERTEDDGVHSQARFRLVIAGSLVVSAFGAIAAFHVYRSEVFTSESVLLSPPAQVEKPITSIAVLPFDSFSDDAGTAYFADGLSEELSTQLAQVKGLQVVARSSAFFYKHEKASINTIAQHLNVGSVLEGSVRQQGDDLRITAQLINTNDGYHIWATNYERKIDDVLEIQNDIAHSVVAALELLLRHDGGNGRNEQTRIDARTYSSYLKARGYLRAPASDDSLAASEALFRQVSAAFPDYAPAHSGLCETLLARYRFSKERDLVPAAEQACTAALSINPAASAVQVALGDLYLLKGEHQQALRAFEAALGLNEKEVIAYRGLARAHEKLGNSEKAHHFYTLALEHQPGYWRAHSDLGLFLIRLARYDEAITQFETAARLNPGSESAFNNLGAARYLNGQFSLAAEAYRHSLAIRPTRTGYSNTGVMHYYASEFKAAKEMFLKAKALAPDDYRTWGNLADALDQLEHTTESPRQAYHEALRLVSMELDVNGDDAELLARAAWFQTKLGQQEVARKMISRAKSLAPQDPRIFFDSGLIAVQLNDKESALTDIRRALELGMSATIIAATPELAMLKEDGKFLNLLDGFDSQ